MLVSEIAGQLFDGLKSGAQKMGQEMATEAVRQVDLGASELTRGLFHEYEPYVQYGPAQHMDGPQVEQAQEQELTLER